MQRLLWLALSFGLASCSTSDPTGAPAQAGAELAPAPRARTVDQIDDYHGTQVADPYRWLEDAESPEVRTWIEAQNQRTQGFLAHSPLRARVRARLQELMNYPRRSAPSRHGKVYASSRNDGLMNQDQLWVADAPGGDGRLLLDPNQLSADGTVALGGASFTKDGTKLAYSISRAGSDWREWYVLDVESGKVLDDHLLWSKFSGAAWTRDGKGFFYTRYPAPEKGKERAAVTEKPQLCYHELGTPQSADLNIYERPDQPRWGIGATMTEEGRYLLIRLSEGTDRRNRIAYLDLQQRERGVQPLLMDFDARYTFVDAVGDTFYFLTDLDAPHGKVIAIDLAQPAREAWRTVIPETSDKLEAVSRFAGRFVVEYLHDAHSLVQIWTLEGKKERDLELPGLGSVGGFTGQPEDRETFFTFTSFTVPATVYHCDVHSGTVKPHWAPKVAFAPQDFATQQVFFSSKDGARIPMFLVHKKGLRLDGSNPTYLYGYGGFNIPMTPAFSTANLAWIELGGVYALANLRGGAEYGEAWHQAGMLERKQNVFDDFLGAAEYLIRNQYTRREKLAIGGGSNGGLLVGAVMTQRPDLFGAAIPEVGVLDMLRYHKFTIGWAWAAEYGSSDDAKMFPFLHKYSPLHNVQDGTHYPATMVMTGDHDDRVHPGHSFKFGARLQAAQAGSAPILVRIETKAGHGAGTPTAKRIEAATDRWTFLAMALGL